jgi:SAM-dependent methyltransferase
MSTDPAAPGYTGVDNLEIMEEAINYNAFLHALVIAQSAPTYQILDFGAGSGVLARPLTTAGYRICCIEPDGELRARLLASGLDAHASLDSIPANSADLIYTVNVLEHIADDRSTVTALRERLKPGGRLLVYVPAFPILYTSMDHKVGHLRRYRRADLTRLLQGAGLVIERIAYQDSLGFAATLVFKLLGNNTGDINRRALITYDRFIFPVSRLIDRFSRRWIGKNLVALARRG